MRGLICWNTDSHLPACILPVKYGIQLEAVPFTSLPPGVTIWLSSSRWRTDIHQKKVVHDDVYRQLCNWCSEQFDSLLEDSVDLLNAPDTVSRLIGPLRTTLGNAKVRPGAVLRTIPFPKA
ncbi:hypothetical protein JST97_09810 [bacterium]|nr:hypothetical protein [bacterium]